MEIVDRLRVNQLDASRLRLLRAMGVEALDVDLRIGRAGPERRQSAEIDEDVLRRVKTQVEEEGLRLHSLFLAAEPALVLGTDGCDPLLEQWRRLLSAMGRVGIGFLGYNFKLGNARTRSAAGRGGALYQRFDLAEFRAEHADFERGAVPAETIRGNLFRFLEAVLPAAEEARVELALHPDDPPLPDPLLGAAQVVASLADFDRIFAAVPSRASKLLFCQGCVAEMGEDVCAAAAKYSRQGKIAWVHFRNIRGRLPCFEEVFHDEGEVDMLRAMRAYRDGGFNGPFAFDHHPRLDHPASPEIGRALATGYLRGLIEAVYGRQAGRRCR